MTETDEMFADRNLNDHPMWARMYNGNSSNYLLPCMCILNNPDPSTNEAVIIWVHKRIRFGGAGSLLLKLLNIRYARILPESTEFWQKCGFQVEKNSNGLDIAILKEK
jgi:hypothetical protein